MLSQFESLFHQLVSFGRRRTGLTEAGSRWKGREESCAPSVSHCHPMLPSGFSIWPHLYPSCAVTKRLFSAPIRSLSHLSAANINRQVAGQVRSIEILSDSMLPCLRLPVPCFLSIIRPSPLNLGPRRTNQPQKRCLTYAHNSQREEIQASKDNMSSLSRRACYKCGNVGHYAEVCTSSERLCYNCKQPGHESNQCPMPRTTESE